MNEKRSNENNEKIMIADEIANNELMAVDSQVVEKALEAAEENPNDKRNNDDSQRTVWLLTIGMFCLSGGYTMIIPFLPVYLLELGIPKSEVVMWSGAVYSVSFFIAGIMAPVWGKMSDKKGKKMMVLRASFGLGLSYLLGGIVQTGWQLFLMRAVQGLANGYVPAAMTMITTSVPKNKIGQSIGIFQTGLISGSVVGPFLGGLIEHWIGMRPAFFAVGTLNIIMTLMIYFFTKEKEPTAEMKAAMAEKTSIIDDIKGLKTNQGLLELLGLFFVAQVALVMLQPVITLYVGKLLGGMNDAAFYAGLILSLGGVAGAIMATIWGKYGQRNGYFKTIYIALFGAGMAIFLQGWLHNIWAFAILQIIVGIFAVGINPSLSAAITFCTEEKTRGRAYGLVTTAQQFGAMAGPLFATMLTACWGIKYVFVTTGVSLFMVSYYVWRNHKTGY